MQEILNPGGLPHVPKASDYQYQDIGAALPPFDWALGYDEEAEIGAIHVDDQGQSTSCGGQAFSKYMAVLRAHATKLFTRRSAKFPYHHTAVLVGGIPQGSRLSDNAEFMRKTGASSEELCPSYEHGNPPTDAFILQNDISTEAYGDAAGTKSLSYAYVPVAIDAVAQAIRDNHGVVILFAGMNNGTWHSEFPKPPTYRQWGHFVYAGRARMIGGKKFIGILNSWGDQIGNGGWQWLGEDYFNSGFVEAIVTFVLQLPTVESFKFTRDLKLGVSGLDVKMLQKYLNAKGFPVAMSDAGSPGRETTYFGALTRTALAKFQAAKGISPAVGYFGPITRAYINSHS